MENSNAQEVQNWSIGFDAVVSLGMYTYVFKGSQYIRYSDPAALTIDAGYLPPLEIIGNFMTYPTDNEGMKIFDSGFDSINLLPNGYLYITKGECYARYAYKDTPGGASLTFSEGPLPLEGNWKELPTSFLSGIDSFATLPNGYTYLTKGSQYVRYSGESAETFDLENTINSDTWGVDASSPFATGFDTMAVLPNGKTYVTRGGEYIRYTDPDAYTIDDGYPRPLCGNWGTLPGC